MDWLFEHLGTVAVAVIGVLFGTGGLIFVIPRMRQMFATARKTRSEADSIDEDTKLKSLDRFAKTEETVEQLITSLMERTTALVEKDQEMMALRLELQRKEAECDKEKADLRSQIILLTAQLQSRIEGEEEA